MGKRFIIECGIITLSGAVLILLLNQFPGLSRHQGLSWGSLAFFTLLTIAIYLIGSRAAHSSNPNSLTQLILAAVMIKLVSCAAIIIAYQELAKPNGNLFVIPFLVLYVVYTVYEVVLLNRLNYAVSPSIDKAK
ncbi:MAG: hypothetical protein KTR24_02195 [Saprospiraceae bacterium]|nr:hypothetical protein [Saprospiraceae bacterium]